MFKSLTQRKFNSQQQLSLFSENTNEEHIMHSKSDDIEIMSYDEIIFRIDFSRYQRQMRGSSYFFNCVNSMDFRCHKRNFRRGSYIDTSD